MRERGGGLYPPAAGLAPVKDAPRGARRSSGVRGPLVLEDPGAGSVDAGAATAARAAVRRCGGIQARGQVSARVCILCTDAFYAPVRVAPCRMLMTLCCKWC